MQNIINQEENTRTEFKAASIELNQDAFDSICGFLNRSGGYLILGVNDDKSVIGIQENKIQNIVDNIVTSANNPEKLNPPYYLAPEIISIQAKKVILVYVPESSQVHATKGKIFDRNQDGDFNITKNAALVAQLYLRKQNSYSENQVFPFLNISDFEPSLFDKVRKLVRNRQPNHPWLGMDNTQMLKSAGLFKRDMKTGEEGYTLAAVLLLGKDSSIQNVLPHYKTDAILRVANKDRYDDRDDIRTNLIESYERLMAFIAKHLPEKFILIDGQRVNVRDNLFREVIGNLLVHREFTNPFPAKLNIEKNQVHAENWNKPHGNGVIDPSNFSPYPKNPMIAKFFKEIGWVDELGSGIRNTYKYADLYNTGVLPQFVEGDVFEITVSLLAKSSEISSEIGSEISIDNPVKKSAEKTRDKIIRLLYAQNDLSAKELAEKIGITERAIEKQIAKLKEQKRLKRIGPDKGGYWLVINK